MKRKEAGLVAGAVTLLQLFSGEREYVSPLFQRQYVWTATEINALWEGVDHIIEGSESERFSGLSYSRSSRREWPSGRTPPGLWTASSVSRLSIPLSFLSLE